MLTNQETQEVNAQTKIAEQAKEMRSNFERQVSTERGGSNLGALVAPNTPASNKGQSYSR